MDEGTIKTPNPRCRLFFRIDLLTDFTDSVWLWGVGGGVLSCVVDHILQKFNTLFLTRLRTYKIATPSQTKMTSKDDI
jgi:hypothetical protein